MMKMKTKIPKLKNKNMSNRKLLDDFDDLLIKESKKIDKMLDLAFWGGIALVCIFIPLGIWKMFEIVVQIFGLLS